MSNKLTFEEFFFDYTRNSHNPLLRQIKEARQIADTSWKFCQAQEQKEIEELEKKVEELEENKELIAKQAATFYEQLFESQKENESLKKKLETCQECDYDNCKGCKLFEGE